MLQVKEDVAWLLEDPSDGGWMPVKDDGHVKVNYNSSTQQQYTVTTACSLCV